MLFTGWRTAVAYKMRRINPLRNNKHSNNVKGAGRLRDASRSGNRFSIRPNNLKSPDKNPQLSLRYPEGLEE